MASPALPGPPGPLRDAAPAALLGRWPDRLWAGTQFATVAQPTLPTGYAELDAELPGGGWPASGLTELLLDAPGSGEWRLLAPALRAQAASRPLVCIAPPLQPYAPALQALGLPLQRFVWVTPPDASNAAADAAWALEQALRSGGIGTALWWGEASATMLRRLHLAALEHGCLLWVLRPLAAREQSSPAPLRLACRPAQRGRLDISVFKRRGPTQAAPLLLRLPAIAGPLDMLDHAVARPAPAVAAA
jgi:protein ImuA